MSLTPSQQGRIDRAREVVEQPHGHGVEDLAQHVGRLDYWLRDMLLMVQELAGEPPSNVSSITRKYGG